MSDGGYWGSTDLVFQCLIDKKRTLALKKTIENCVRNNDVVVDLGSGSGILAMCAIGAGAKKVYAVEADIDICHALRMTIEKNNLSEKIILLEGDATTINLPEKVDVVLCEMIATGLLDELQLSVMKNISRFFKPETKVIPAGMKNYIDLVCTDNTFYGHKLYVVQYEYGYCDESERATPIQMTDRYMYCDVDLTKDCDPKVDVEFTMNAKSDGTINGLRFTNLSSFPDGSTLGGTPAYCMPLIMPVPEFRVKIGEELKIKVSYTMCTGLHNLVFSLIAEKSNGYIYNHNVTRR